MTANNLAALNIIAEHTMGHNPSQSGIFNARITYSEVTGIAEIEILDSYHQGFTLTICRTVSSGHWTGG